MFGMIPTIQRQSINTLQHTTRELQHITAEQPEVKCASRANLARAELSMNATLGVQESALTDIEKNVILLIIETLHHNAINFRD